MNDPLTAAGDDALMRGIGDALARPVPPAVARVAARLRAPGVVAVLFYGSILRTGDLAGVLDYYVLTDVPRAPAIWPEVSYREFADPAGTLRAKIATMPLATFAQAARGETRDTTIWARFVQPAALVWATDDARAPVVAAVADAVATATRFAAALGPTAGAPLDFWRALFRATYAAEFRVEAGGRGDQIVDHDPLRYAALLPLGWTRAGIAWREDGDALVPDLAAAERRRLLRNWARVARWGKPLNVARLVKAAFTFEGAGRYAAWKIERHTGVPVPLTPWQERHPILAAPGVLWRVRRAKR